VAQLLENFGKGKYRADSVAVGSRVRGEEEARMSAEGCENGSDPALLRESFVSRLEFLELCLWGHDLTVNLAVVLAVVEIAG
jgi:hypothetical protein